jgi:hypothetical protein
MVCELIFDRRRPSEKLERTAKLTIFENTGSKGCFKHPLLLALANAVWLFKHLLHLCGDGESELSLRFGSEM